MQRFRQTLKRTLPAPIVDLLGKMLRLTWAAEFAVVRLIYHLTGWVPKGIKYRDSRSYWTERGGTFYQEDIATKAHSSAVQLAFREEFLQELAASEFASVLEAGCGYCRELVPVYDRFPHARVFGVDFSPTMLADAVRHRNGRSIHLLQGSVAALPFPDNSFDITFTTGVVQHIPFEMAVSAFDELIRVTRHRIYHREIYRRQIAPKSDLKERFDLSPFLFAHDYDAIYHGRGHQVIKSDISPAYRNQPGREIWYSLIVVALNKQSAASPS